VEPITAAVAAFTAVKSGIQAGRELQDMVGELGKLWGGLDTARASHNQKRTKAMRNEFISVEEEALKTFADKRKADEIEKELHQFITYTLGAEAWAQLIEIRGQVRKQRQEQAAAALKQKRKIIDGILIAAAVIFSGFAIYWMGYIVINKGF
jgi:hypothetical protein|tara:strand:- start:1240 stop:1695 length:456 start_codon:yes stop_codon:yes gene_type:complete